MFYRMKCYLDLFFILILEINVGKANTTFSHQQPRCLPRARHAVDAALREMPPGAYVSWGRQAINKEKDARQVSCRYNTRYQGNRRLGEVVHSDRVEELFSTGVSAPDWQGVAGGTDLLFEK